MPRPGLQTDPAPPTDLVLRSTTNWTAVLFFGMLSFLHLSIAIPAFAAGRWEGFLSLILGVLFVAVSACAGRVRWEVSILPAERVVRQRGVMFREWHRRDLPFARVTAVRLTLAPGGPAEARIEILSVDGNDVECPPTTVPRQEALLLAMTMNVPLTRVSEEDGDAANEERLAGERSEDHPEATRRPRM